MKNLTLTLRKYASARAFLVFSILFYLAMYVSKTVHALWFNEQHALPLYGFSYTMMAVAGVLSFLTGRLGDIFSPSFALRTGVIFYSIGLFLRIITNSIVIAGLSGFIAGIGASLVIVSMRHWILSIGEQEDRPAIVSLKETSRNVGTSIGTAIAGISVIGVSLVFSKPLPVVLILSAILCFSSLLFIPKIQKTNKKDTKEKEKTNSKPRVSKRLLVGVITFGVIAGLTVSMLAPYLPIILNNQGVSVSLIGIYMALISICGVISSPMFSGKKINENKTKIFFLSELFVGIVTLLFILNLPSIVIPLILILRAFFMAGSIISQELLELDMFPKYAIGMLYGFSQSSFFIGDAIGGTLGGFLYNLNQDFALLACALLTLINALLFTLFYKYIKQTSIAGDQCVSVAK
ncbi:hypothetical protein J8TS2_38600 [Lederbergia ruris]|uniref:Major facilitator superfamily (MFS) profile domain-containing protein n=1 Tax=Lederbergia ruris TaxID=217495 RepID=A0ABQ4KNL2_9BACI|nr:MFS transporter [Lederbergia ruris]MBW8350580.1 MFS transporter [Bacillus sp. IITD106]GIN59541.1 hypothetical protein J8TS2_38600 [Lederbergia ruris]